MQFDISAAKKNLQRRSIERREALKRSAERAERDARLIIGMLIERYKPLRIYRSTGSEPPILLRDGLRLE
jgi:hypothetical protein